MKKIVVSFLIIWCTNLLNAQILEISIDTSKPNKKIKTGDDLLDVMYNNFKHGPCKAYTFSQRNTHYRNDSITGKSEWHEAIEFPDKFRIDFGDKATGNFVIFRNDSSYRFKDFKLKKITYDANSLLLILGGMYYRPLEDVLQRLKKDGYNTNVLSTQKMGKQTYYVIGALKGDTTSNQIWVNKDDWRVTRIIEKMDEKSTMDISFDSFQKHCNGYVETKVTFKRNGVKEQVEEYYDIKEVSSFAEDVFYPKQ